MTALIGVYRGAGADGIKRLPAFTALLGRKPDMVVDFAGGGTWAEIQNSATWAFGYWHGQIGQLCASIPMLCWGQTFAEGAAGKFDAEFVKLANMLVAKGWGGCYVRLGWEMNGGWYAWAAKADPVGYRRMFERVALLFRSVSPIFRIVWCPAQGEQQVNQNELLPDPAFFDVIAMDVYNQSWKVSVADKAALWKEIEGGYLQLGWLAAQAARLGKRIALPEWGTGTRPDGHGGGDDANFVTNMAAWIRDHDVEFHCYWDYPASDFNAEISGMRNPLAAAAYKAAFGATAAPVPAPTPAPAPAPARAPPVASLQGFPPLVIAEGLSAPSKVIKLSLGQALGSWGKVHSANLRPVQIGAGRYVAKLVRGDTMQTTTAVDPAHVRAGELITAAA